MAWFRRRRPPAAPAASTRVLEPVEHPADPLEHLDDDDERRAVDVCFVFDTTGSMSDKIDGLVECMVDFVGELSALRLNWRITTVPYGDLTVAGERIVGDLPFVRNHDDAVQQLRTLPRFFGGDNAGESTLEAVVAALDKPFRARAVPVLVVLTDEPPLTEQLSPEDVGERITVREAICFVASPDRPEYRRWAEDNGGQWYEIGQSMDTTRLVGYLRSLVRDLPRVADRVHELGGGSVRRYLQEKDG